MGADRGLSLSLSLALSAVGHSILGLSLVLNAALTLLLLSRPRVTVSLAEGSAASFAPRRSGAAHLAARGSGLDPRYDGEVFRRLLERAEAVYQRHMALKEELVGTREEVAFPFAHSVDQAMARAHGGWSADDWAMNVFRREYLLVPRYPCFEEERVGTWGEGGKWLCLVSLHKKPDDLIVYSVGSQGDTSFERGVFRLLGATSHTFDPFLTLERIKKVSSLPFIHFHNYGLTGGATEEVFDQATNKMGELRALPSIMADLGHSFIDLLKVDCEGCEEDFVAHLGNSTARDRPIFGQLLMEIHNVNNLAVESALLRTLRQLGFRMFHSEVNFFAPGNVFEVAFIHQSLVNPALLKSS